MAREVEVKLEIDPVHLEKLSSQPQFRQQPHRERLKSVYFDTPKGKLRRHGWLLRVRQGDHGWVQTIKHSADGAGLFDRDEWESDVQGPQPDLPAIADTPLKTLIKAGQFHDLAPVFQSDVQRSTWKVSANGGTIEASYDEGLIEAGDASEPIHELELELIEGDISLLLGAAKRIGRQIPLKLGVLSKAERGFAIADGRRNIPVKATQVTLNEKANVAEGFSAIVTACLKHFRLNEPLFLSERNAEALHQLRVAIRRLRTALWLFKPAAGGGEFAGMHDQLRTLTRELGAARNIDVILASMPTGNPVRGKLEQDRGHLYASIQRKLNTRAFRSLVLDLLTWVHVGEWRHGERASRPLMAFAVKRLDRLWRAIGERAVDLVHLSDADRHRLRIDTKKIRYSLEFLSEPLRDAGTAQKRFVDAAEGLQDSLGLLNDFANRRKLVGEADWPLPMPDGSDGREAKRQLRAAKRHLRELRKIGPYWREA